MPTINIDPEFPHHRKTKKLMRLAGESAAFRLVQLWCYAAEAHPEDGNLAGYSPDDIEDAAGWNGEKGVFYNALINSNVGGDYGFLEPSGQLHDWNFWEGHIKLYRDRAKLMNSKKTNKSTTLSQRSQQASEQANSLDSRPVTVTVTVTEPEGENNGSTSGESGGCSELTSTAGAVALSLAREETNEQNGSGSKPTASGGAPKLNGDDVVEQPVRVLEIAKFVTKKFPNSTIRQREGLAGRIEKLARGRKHELIPEEAAKFAEIVLAEAPTFWQAQAFVTVLEQPCEDTQVYEAVKAARNGHGVTNGRGP